MTTARTLARTLGATRGAVERRAAKLGIGQQRDGELWFTPEEITRLLDDRRQPNVTLLGGAALAKEFGISLPTLHHWYDQLGIDRRGSGRRNLTDDEIARLRALCGPAPAPAPPNPQAAAPGLTPAQRATLSVERTLPSPAIRARLGITRQRLLQLSVKYEIGEQREGRWWYSEADVAQLQARPWRQRRGRPAPTTPDPVRAE